MTNPHPQPEVGQTRLENAIKQQLLLNQMPVFENYLFDKIVSRLDYEQKLKELKPKLWAGISVFAASLGLLVFAVFDFIKVWRQTPAFHFLALSFTDFGLVVNNWQDYAFSILESLPLGVMALLLGACLASIILADFSKHQWSSFRKIFYAYHH
jgi:hypothetical protein